MDNLSSLLAEYLGKTRLLSPLGLRQAKMFSLRVQEPMREEAHQLLLLLLHWWERGAAGVSISHLREPISREMLALMHGEFVEEWNPQWDALSVPALDAILKNPSGFEPLISHQLEKLPLVVVDRERGLFSFQRAFSAVRRLEDALRLRLVDLEPLTEDMLLSLQKSFANVSPTFHFRQVAACALALRTRFLILSGGPGTGKTSVVIQILRTLFEYDSTLQQDRVMLCAPTGRAKARMGESVHSAFPNMPSATLHSLLGQRPDGGFRHHARNLLPYQVVVVDEASMVDLHLFAGLLDALHCDARLILIGDMHQLPSVDAGAVLGDLTEGFGQSKGQGSLSTECNLWIQDVLQQILHSVPDGQSTALDLEPRLHAEVGALLDHTMILNHTYRSAKGIQHLCECINSGDSVRVEQALESEPVKKHVAWHDRLQTADASEFMDTWWKQSLDAKLFESIRGIDPTDPDTHSQLGQAFAQILKHRVLVLSHQGDLGRVELNKQADQIFRKAYDHKHAGTFYHGQQILLTHNHHGIGLFNGDLGLMMECQQGFRAIFRQGSTYAAVNVDMLVGVESAYAMTVHKSQGSEFEKVLLVLPERDTPLLNRQILYTGITRAKSKVEILGTKEILRRGVERRDVRPGGVKL